MSNNPIEEYLIMLWGNVISKMVKYMIIYDKCYDHWCIPHFCTPHIYISYSDPNLLTQNFETASKTWSFSLVSIYSSHVELKLNSYMFSSYV